MVGGWRGGEGVENVWEKDLNRPSSKVHKWPISRQKGTQHLVIREMQIQPTMRQHFTLTKTVITKKITSVGKNVEKHTLVGGNVKMVQSHWKTVWQFPKKLELP